MTCDCTDAGRSLWYLEWSAFALSHGHQLLFSTWMFHPVGFNLLDDTSVPVIGLIMSPVTLVFGPVTAINVASTLIPALTALVDVLATAPLGHAGRRRPSWEGWPTDSALW